MKRNVIKRTNALFALAVCTGFVFASLMGSCKNSSGGDDEIVKSTEKTLIEFSFEKAHNTSLSADIKGIINKKTKTVSVEVPAGTDKTKLKASFKISGKAQLFIGSIEQQSGVTENNFSDIIALVVDGIDGTFARRARSGVLGGGGFERPDSPCLGT